MIRIVVENAHEVVAITRYRYDCNYIWMGMVYFAILLLCYFISDVSRIRQNIVRSNSHSIP